MLILLFCTPISSLYDAFNLPNGTVRQPAGSHESTLHGARRHLHLHASAGEDLRLRAVYVFPFIQLADIVDK
jgi:hypothetical protein